MIKEFELIEQIKKQIPRKLQGGIGIGDDADLLGLRKNRAVVTSDVIVEDVDFVLSEVRASQIGHKALAVNLSDLAAMGAAPKGFVIAAGLSPDLSALWVKQCYRGMMKLAKKFHVKCLGGDLSKSSKVFLSVTAIGELTGLRPVLRSGARPGDLIAVTGKLGGSILGRHLSFVPRIRESQWLVRNVGPTSMIDISDGFCQDLEHIVKASRVSGRVDLKKIPIADAARLRAGKKRRQALRHALSDGEDFELLFTVPPSKQAFLEKAWRRAFPQTRLSWVGIITRGKPELSWYEGARQVRFSKKDRKGYEHF